MAQEIEEIPPVGMGSHSLSFGLGASGLFGLMGLGAAPTVGYWYFAAENVNIGVDFWGSLLVREQREDRVDLRFSVAPGIKYYFSQRANVAPFFYGAAQIAAVQFGDSGEQVAPENEISIGAAIAFGAEWFFVPNASLAGRLGINSTFINPAQQQVTMTAATTSSLSLQLYF